MFSVHFYLIWSASLSRSSSWDQNFGNHFVKVQQPWKTFFPSSFLPSPRCNFLGFSFSLLSLVEAIGFWRFVRERTRFKIRFDVCHSALLRSPSPLFLSVRRDVGLEACIRLPSKPSNDPPFLSDHSSMELWQTPPSQTPLACHCCACHRHWRRKQGRIGRSPKCGTALGSAFLCGVLWVLALVASPCSWELRALNCSL